jgi:hypothetical protein
MGDKLTDVGRGLERIENRCNLVLVAAAAFMAGAWWSPWRGWIVSMLR